MVHDDGEIPEKWSIVKLGDVANESKERFIPNGNAIYTYVGLEHMESGINRIARTGLSSDVTSSKTVFKVGDTLFGKLRPYLKKVALSDIFGVCSTDILAIRPSKQIDPYFLCTVLSSDSAISHSIESSAGTKMPRTSWKEMSSFNVFLPPIIEQQKIAAILSSVDDAIQATQAVIDQTRRVKQGLLQQLLTRGIGHTRFKLTEIGEIPETWGAIPLGDFGNFTNGINKGKEDFGFGIPFVNLQDVFGVNRISSLPKGLVNATQQEIQRYSLKGGDVLFVRSSVKPSGVGLTAVITDNIDDVVFSGFLIRYRQSKPKLTAKYLEHCFYEPGFRQRLLVRSSVSANTNINQKALEQLLVAIPSEVEQKQISSVLDSVDCAINQEQQKVAALTKIKCGLMQDLLTGRVRVKV